MSRKYQLVTIGRYTAVLAAVGPALTTPTRGAGLRLHGTVRGPFVPISSTRLRDPFSGPRSPVFSTRLLRSDFRTHTDGWGAACRSVMPSVVHCTDQYANNRAEVSHQPTRQRQRQMRGFKSAVHLQRFASVLGVVQNLFRVGRHLLRAVHHRLLRTRAFVEWDVVTCAY